VNEDRDIYFKAYKIYALSKDRGVTDELARIINNRALRGLVDYMVISFVSRRGQETILLMTSDNSLSVDMESEVFLTMMNSLGLARVEETELDGNTVRRLKEMFKTVRKGVTDHLILVPSAPDYINRSKAKSYDIVIGETLDTPTPVEVGLQLSDIASHVAIFGSTGSGKSTTASVLSCRIWSKLKVPVVIIDWTGEYEELMRKIGCRSKVEVMDPLERGPIVDPLRLKIKDVDLISEILGKALGLSWPQIYLLSSVLEESLPSSLQELVALIEASPESSKWDREVKRGLLRKLGILAKGQGTELLKKGSFNPSEFEWSGVTVLDVSNIRLSLLRRAYALLFLASLFVTRLDKRGFATPLFIFVDEAHNVFDPSDIPFTDNLIAESRKLGMWLGVVTQSPSAISNAVLLNTSTKIIHALRSARDKMIVIDTMNLRRDYVDVMDRLDVGQAILSAPSLGEPVLIRIKLP